MKNTELILEWRTASAASLVQMRRKWKTALIACRLSCDDLKGSGWLMRPGLNGCFILMKFGACCFRSWELRSELWFHPSTTNTHWHFWLGKRCGLEIKDEGALIDAESLLALCVFYLRRTIRNSFCDLKLLQKSSRLPDALWVTCSITPKQLRAKDANFIYTSRRGIIRALREP